MSPEEKFARARTAHEAGRLSEAESQYRALLIQFPGHPDVNHMLGILCGQTGRVSESVDCIRASIKAVPKNPQFHYNLGNALMQMSAWEEAGVAFKKSLELAPDNPEAHFNIGITQIRQARPDSAISSFRRAVRINPDFAPALSELSNCLGARGDLAEAIELQERAIGLMPNVAGFHANLGLLKLRNHEWGAAVESFERALSLEPWNVPALANKAVALFENGEDDAAKRIADPETLLEIGELVLPETIDRTRLADRLAGHKSCVWQRADITTKGGAQTDNLVDDPDPMIAEFVGLLTSRVDHFVKGLESGADHPFRARIPAKWDFKIWATILFEDGHQNPHLHPAGWLSGVYYLEVPDHVGSPDNKDCEGWIEFGTPGYGIEPVRVPNTRLVQPEHDKLVLFPSYLYHKTVPLIGNDRRISIAFDLIPKEWRT